jgi:hypothetical protein
LESLIFIGVLACLGLVVGWYAANEAAGRNGDKGLFELKAGPDSGGAATGGVRYRIKSRARPTSRKSIADADRAGAKAYRRKPPRTFLAQHGAIDGSLS